MRDAKLEQLFQATLPGKEEESKNIRPTLLVGLGGTGKEIILRFRRLIIERYGSIRALPFIQFMQLDTDSTKDAMEQYNLKSDDDPLYPKVRFDTRERIGLKIDGGPSKFIEHLNKYPQIKRWYHSGSKLAALGDLGEGAGQVRMASRLGFFDPDNYSQVSARLAAVKMALSESANEKKAMDLGFTLDTTGTEIVVVASLSGGTGSGVFLDMAYVLQKFFPGADRTGIFMLPHFFIGYPGEARMRANGYAALTELNFFSFGHLFTGDWDGVAEHMFPPPPYANTYLIDARNEANLSIGSNGREFDAYQMVAEFLFQDFSIGKFAGKKRATRVNLQNFNLNVYSHNFLTEALSLDDHEAKRKNVVGDTYPTRFGSFGLATLHFPTDRVHSACACRLATKIMDHWQKSAVVEPLEQLFTSFLIDSSVSFAQGRYERRDGGGIIKEMHVEDALLWYERGGGRTFPSFIWEKAQSVRSEVEAAAKGEKATTLKTHCHQLDQNLAREDSSDPDEWGVWVRTLETNMESYLERLKSGIKNKASVIANDPKSGVIVTLSLLRELKALLANDNYFYLDYFEQGIKEWRELTSRYKAELDRLLMDVAKHDRQFLFRKPDLGRAMQHLVADSDQDEDLGALYNYYYARVMKQVCKRGKAICEAIDEFLGKDDPTGKGLIGEYYQLVVGFGQLKDRLARQETYFSRQQESELTVSLYRDGDVDVWYRNWLGDTKREEETINTVGNQLLERVFHAASVTEALAHIQQKSVDEVEDEVLARCKEFFSAQDEQPHALQLLFDGDRFTSQDREEKVRLAYKQGKVRLAKAERGLEHTGMRGVEASQRPLLIGIDQSDGPRLTQFKELVGRVQTPGDSPPSYLEVGTANQGTIVFYSELAGVTAFYPSSVTAAQGLAEAYRAFPDKDELHIDKNRFQFGELIPKDRNLAQNYLLSLKAFVLARMLGLLTVLEIKDRNAEHSSFHYSYKRKEGLEHKEVRLGDEFHAVDYLYRQGGKST